MDIVHNFLDFFLHLDKHMDAIVTHYGSWTYGILFIIIFAETGFVFTPFLPGDSLLFIVGALAAKGTLHLEWLLGLLSVAAIAGDSLNYAIGRFLAPRVFNNEHIPFLKREHLIKTQEFYDRHGVKTIVYARFFPIIRTVAPFLAGVGSMPYMKFIMYNVVGGILWVAIGTLCGFFFGNLPIVRDNFSAAILIIAALSMIPAILQYKNLRKRIKTS